MRGLTPLERMFVEEFCRFASLPLAEIDRLRVVASRSNPAGFVSEVTPETVSDRLRWPLRFYESQRMAVVGNEPCMLMLLVFDRADGRLVSIEGDAMTHEWNEVYEPAYWSETDRVIDARRHD